MAQVNVTGLQSNTANRIKAQQNNSQGAINEGTATAQAAFDAEVSAINKLNTNMLMELSKQIYIHIKKGKHY